jgi:putative cardiolipin synthase
MLQTLVFIFFAFALYVLIARVFFGLPDRPEPSRDQPSTDLSTSLLSTGIKKLNAQHEHLSGIKILDRGIDAFVARMALIQGAERSIDLQYYIWHKDITGLMLLTALKEAANRGVRVRLLVDDNGISGMDEIFSELNQHPRVDVRLYNPFVLRNFKILNFTFDFFRLNRRMHNKSLVVDDVVAISGGRNIGDEYFGIGENTQFVDLDILTIGQVIPAFIDHFNLFFNSDSAYPIDTLIKHENNTSSQLDTESDMIKTSRHYDSYLKAINANKLVDEIINNTIHIEWVEVTMTADDPGKTTGSHQQSDLMVSRLTDILDKPNLKLDIVSPYFVPGDAIDMFLNLESEGVNVRILTNSFEATDVIPVHSGYAKYRKKLLSSGAELYELKSDITKDKDTIGLMGSSASSLHAKTFAVDESLVFIGSFNFDPRSTMLNTEMGVLIKSPNLAKAIHRHFDDDLNHHTYHLSLDKNREVVWFEQSAGGETTVYHDDPNASGMQKFMIKLLGILPINWLL